MSAWIGSKRKKSPPPPAPICRILTNARCLSEGVDVPSLDAVIFLNPRKSQVDVIQAVGRVMRKAPGKEFGYVILPIAIPAGIPPENALADNERYRVIWQVLQALRAHDDRIDATVNSIQYNTSDPSSIVVDIADFSSKKPAEDHFSGEAHDYDDPTGKNPTDPLQPRPIQGQFIFSPIEWKDALYSRIVKNVGDRLYWDDWSKDIADIATRYIALIDRLLEDPVHQDVFDRFIQSLRRILNPSIDGAQAVEMLAQHIITKPLFDAMFDDQQFTAKNPVSRAMQAVLDVIGSNEMFVRERQPLEAFYTTMVNRIRQIDSIAGRQQIMVTIYNKFFTKAFPDMASRLGIVFTPVEVVDYILHSANDALKEHFGKTLGDSGVELLEPFLGTGTFISRLLSSGIIPPEQLEHKYRNEIFGNEIVLLAYYIASINIEAVYRQIRLAQGYSDEYAEFTGISLTDTFQLTEDRDVIPGAGFDFAENIERLQRQRQANIRVIVMNPPYSAGQRSANDNNQNLKYPHLDQLIEESYVARSTASSKIKLYDSYFRALRWATERIGDEGIIAFVSNNSFLDGNSADGVRLTFQDEFSDIYLFNLKGNQRTQGDRSRKEGGKIFGSGARTGIAITLLIKDPTHEGPARIHYAEVDDYLTRDEKLRELTSSHSISGTSFRTLTPNKDGDWLNQRDDTFTTFQTIGDKATKGKVQTPAIITQFSNGLATSRDAWCYNFSRKNVEKNMRRMIANYNAEVDAEHTKETASTDPLRISWNRQLFRDLDRGKAHRFVPQAVRTSIYRPFTRQTVYFDRSMNGMIYQLPRIFPTEQHPNLAITSSLAGSKPFMPLMVDVLPDLHLNGDAQCFPLYTWEKINDGSELAKALKIGDIPGTATTSDSNASGSQQALDILSVMEQADGGNSVLVNEKNATPPAFDFNQPIADQIPEILNGYRRRDNITDATLLAYRAHYADEPTPAGEEITKEDIFFYVYALLHHPSYRERYEADLKKMLPRIPRVPGFWEFANIGRELAALHVNYEAVEPYPLSEEWSVDAPEDEWARYRVEKPKWKTKGDPTRFVYNEFLTFSGIPASVNDYQVGGRSPLEWVIDRYKVTVDKKSQIRNDPNDYFREVDNPHYLADLIKSLVTVSLRTTELTQALPELIIEETDRPNT
ncbi:type ISP restriction/modification enzyme [Schaalia sp. ZJ1691]|uniref:type ISP restriction/modification enzyme n=1 Tax=Schaalia sp. ZJ1691 TaxID=2709404 RepID=UPI0032174DF2